MVDRKIDFILCLVQLWAFPWSQSHSQLQNTTAFTTQVELFIAGMPFFIRSQTRREKQIQNSQDKTNTHCKSMSGFCINPQLLSQDKEKKCWGTPQFRRTRPTLQLFPSISSVITNTSCKALDHKTGRTTFLHSCSSQRKLPPLPSHNTTCREEKGKIQEQWTHQRNMSEGRISAWYCVTVMVSAKDNRYFSCLSQMMIPSWNFFFHFNYLILHFPNILLVHIWGAGIQKAPVRASDASSCVRFFVPWMCLKAHVRGKTTW